MCIYIYVFTYTDMYSLITQPLDNTRIHNHDSTRNNKQTLQAPALIAQRGELIKLYNKPIIIEI